MDNIVILEAADHMYDCIHFPDMAEELVPESFTPAGAFHQAGDIHKLNRCGRDLLRMVHLRQYIQPVVRNHHNTGIGLNRTEWIILGLRTRICNSIEQGAFPDVWQSNNSELHFIFKRSFRLSGNSRPRRPYQQVIIMMHLPCVKLSKSICLW